MAANINEKKEKRLTEISILFLYIFFLAIIKYHNIIMTTYVTEQIQMKSNP